MKALLRKPAHPAMRPEFEQFIDRFFNTPLRPLTMPRMEGMWEPVLDLSETEKEYVVRLEVPGVTRDDLDVKLDGNLLTLSGKRELHKEEKGEDYLWEEREEGRFMRTLRLPGRVDEGAVEATYSDGVLMVKAPKAAAPAKSRVTIK